MDSVSTTARDLVATAILEEPDTLAAESKTHPAVADAKQMGLRKVLCGDASSSWTASNGDRHGRRGCSDVPRSYKRLPSQPWCALVQKPEVLDFGVAQCLRQRHAFEASMRTPCLSCWRSPQPKRVVSL